MQLSQNFTLEELIVTQTGLPNVPNPQVIENLRVLAVNLLQPLRMLYGKPLTVNSGYRSSVVNAAVGGSLNSSHMNGEAADLKCDNNAALFMLCRARLDFDQLIWENGDSLQPAWVHVSYRKSGNRREVLRKTGNRYIKI